MLVVALNDHTHNSVFFVVVILFLLVLLQQVFSKTLQIKLSLVLVTNYSINDHTHNSVFFVVILFLLVLLQQILCKIPANQIIISTYN